MIKSELHKKSAGSAIEIDEKIDLTEFKDLNHLRFADDVVLIAKNGNELNSVAEDLRKASEEYSLSINLTKTKVISNISNLG